MSIKILTNRQVYNTNIDGARMNNFSAGMRDGIIKGSFGEGRFFASASNVIALGSCVLLLSGHEVIIDSPEYITLNNNPAKATRYSMIAEIKVEIERIVKFRLFIQSSNIALIKDKMFENISGEGTYQVEIGRFTLRRDGTVTDVVRTIDVITGGGKSNGGINIGNVTTEKIDYTLNAEVDINQRYDEEQQKEFIDFNFLLPVDVKEQTITQKDLEDYTYSKKVIDDRKQNKLVAKQISAGTTYTEQNDTVKDYWVSSDNNTWYKIWVSGRKECGTTITIAEEIDKMSSLESSFICPISIDHIISERASNLGGAPYSSYGMVYTTRSTAEAIGYGVRNLTEIDTIKVGMKINLYRAGY